MTRYQSGVRYERETLKYLRALGYLATRTAGSHGVADIWAMNHSHVRLIQVKYTKDTKKNMTSVINKVSDEFNAIPTPKNVYKELWIYSGKNLRIIKI